MGQFFYPAKVEKWRSVSSSGRSSSGGVGRAVEGLSRWVGVSAVEGPPLLEPLCKKSYIDEKPRWLERPSDHAPVVVEFSLSSLSTD